MGYGILRSRNSWRDLQFLVSRLSYRDLEIYLDSGMKLRQIFVVYAAP